VSDLALSTPSGLIGLNKLLAMPPVLSLDFYSFGAILRRTTEEGTTEYPVDPEQIALALATRVRFETGLLGSNTLYVSMEGVARTVAEYRQPQRTRLHIEGTTKPFNVPLPGLIFVRQTNGEYSVNYAIYAVKHRPTSFDEPLYAAPLPNVYDSGSICWGSVRQASKEALASTSLEEDWALLLGTPFNNHSVHGRSKSHPRDIREKYADMEKRRSRVYPISDLIPTKRTLGSLLGVSDNDK